MGRKVFRNTKHTHTTKKKLIMHYCTNAFVLFFFDLMAAWLNKVRCPGSPFCQLWYIQHDGRISDPVFVNNKQAQDKAGKKKNRNQPPDSTKAIKSYSSLLTCEVKSSILVSFVVCFLLSWVSPAVSHSTRKFSWFSRSALDEEHQHQLSRMVYQFVFVFKPEPQNIMDH